MQFQKNNFWRKNDQKGTFRGVKWRWRDQHSIKYVNYLENETIFVVDAVPPKARILEVWVLLMSTKILVKIFWPLGVCLARCCAGSVHSYIGGYVLKYVVKYIVMPSYLSITYIPQHEV